MEKINNVWFENERIYMLSSEDKVYSRPLEAFPILKEASEAQREAYTIEMRGTALRWKELDEDIHISGFYDTTEPEYSNEIAKIFKCFPQLNVSEVARTVGINKSLLAKYIYGIKKPGDERVTQIKEALHMIGSQLIAI